MAKDKSEKKINRFMNSIITGMDLGDGTSLATILSPTGDIEERFSFQLTEQNCEMEERGTNRKEAPKA